MGDATAEDLPGQSDSYGVIGLRLFKNQPRTVWLICLGLLPIWLLAAGGIYLWVSKWPVASEAISIPQPENGRQARLKVRSKSLDSYNCIWTRPLQQELIVKKPPPPPKPQMQTRTVDAELIGTAIEGNDSYAFIRTKSGAIRVARVGSVIDSFLVAAVYPDRVCLSRDGIVTYIVLPEAMRKLIPSDGISEAVVQQKQIASERYHGSKVERSGPEQLIARLGLKCSVGEFLDNVRLVPHVVTRGRQRGFRIDSVSPTSLVAVCGLAAGDVIVSVDGQDLVQITDMERLCNSLGDGQPHNWQVRRRGMNLEVQVNHVKEAADEVS